MTTKTNSDPIDDTKKRFDALIQEKNKVIKLETTAENSAAKVKKARQQRNDNDSKVAQAETYLKQKYEFRYNVLSNENEYRKKGQKPYIQLEDREFNTLLTELHKSNIEISENLLKAVINSAFTNEYDPVNEYTGSLPAYDGNTDFIQQIANGLPVNPEYESIRNDIIKRFFAATYCQMLGIRKNDFMLVLIGNQGIGKSRFIRAMLPKGLEKFATKLNPDQVGSKDADISLGCNIFIEFDELENLSKADASKIKSYISTANVKVRKPYGRTESHITRRASCIGSSNTADILNDPTGSRRFLILDVIDKIQMPTPELINNAFAQIKHEINNGYSYYMTLEQIQDLNSYNSNFASISEAAEAISQFLVPYNENQPQHNAVIMSTTEIKAYLEKELGLKILENTNRIGRILKQQGFIKNAKRNNSKCWKVVKLTSVLPD